MSDICEGFARNKGLDYQKLNFKYGNQLLDKSKTFEETANENDKNIGKIEINVEEQIIIKEKNDIQNKVPNNNESESFFKKHKKKFLIGLIISIIIVVALLVTLIVVLKTKKTEKTKKTKIMKNNPKGKK